MYIIKMHLIITITEYIYIWNPKVQALLVLTISEKWLANEYASVINSILF